jgi:hypothetical protein
VDFCDDVVTVGRGRLAQPPHRLPGRGNGERRVGRETGDDRIGFGRQFAGFDDCENKPARAGFRRVERLGEQQHSACSAQPESAFEPRDVADRQTVSQGARDGRAEAGARRGDPEIAGGRDDQSAHRRAVDDGEGGHGQMLDLGYPRLDPPFVGDAVFARIEGGEFADVGAGDEGSAAAAKHRGAQSRRRGDRSAGVREFVVHGESHRVARGGRRRQSNGIHRRAGRHARS